MAGRWARRAGRAGRAAGAGVGAGARRARAQARGAHERGTAATGGANGRAGLQGRASCAATRQPCATTRPGGSATTRPDPPTTRLHTRGHALPRCGLGAGWACWLGQLSQFGALCTWLSSDSIFRPGLTQYCSWVTK